MDRFFGGKSHQKEGETSKPRIKHSHRKPSSDDQRALPRHKLLFPTNRLNDDPVIPFSKTRESSGFGAPRRLKGGSRSKIRHMEKNFSVNKILGAICNNPALRVQKSRSAKRLVRDHSPVPSESSSSSPQQAEHRSYHKIKKRRKEREENLQRRFEEDEDYRRNEESQLGEEDDYLRRYFKDRKEEGERRGNNFYGNIELKSRNVSKKLTFSSSESQSEGSPSLLKEYSGFVGRRGSDIAEIEVVGESSQSVMIADNRDPSKNPVVLKPSKPLMNEQDLLTEYTHLTALITDQLTMEQQKHFNDKSYLETGTQNLLNVFLKSGNKNTDELERKGSANSTGTIFEGFDFVTPVMSRIEAGNLSKPWLLNEDFRTRSSPVREVESRQLPPHKGTAALGFFSKDKNVSAPKGIFPVDTSSACNPKSPELDHVEESPPCMPLFFQRNSALCSLATTDDFGGGKPNDEVTFIDGVFSQNIDKGRIHLRKETSNPTNCGSYGKESSRPPKRTYRECSFSSPPTFSRNDDILELFSAIAGNPESLASRHHNTKETERNFRRRSCTATSATPVDYYPSVSPPPPSDGQTIEDFKTSFLDQVDNVRMREEDVFSADQVFYRQRDKKEAFPLHVNPCGSTVTRFRESTDLAETSQKESFLNSVGLLVNKNLRPKKKDWISPKFYRRRMF